MPFRVLHIGRFYSRAEYDLCVMVVLATLKYPILFARFLPPLLLLLFVSEHPWVWRS
jgi:hypothetical protein